MAERDPRIDPRPGYHVQTRFGGDWHVLRREYGNKAGSVIFHHGNAQVFGGIGLKRWRQFTKTATIIKRGTDV